MFCINAQPVVQRATGNRQDAAGQSSAGFAAAAFRMRGAGSGSDSIGRQRGSLDSLAAAAVQATAPFGFRAGIGRWQLSVFEINEKFSKLMRLLTTLGDAI